jgi:DNA modification methylase
MRKWKEQGIKAQTCVTSPPYYGLRDYGHDGQIGLEETPEEYIAAMVDVFRCVWDVLEDNGTLWLNIGDSYYNYRPGQGQRQGKQSIASQKFSEVEICHKRGLKLDGLKEKDLIGIPWMLAFALRADGWYLRQDIIWHKPNPMPESVQDRCTKAHEYIFLMSKSQKYYYDHEVIKEASVDPEGSANRYKAPFFAGEKHESGGYSATGATHTKGMKEFDGNRNKRSVWTVNVKPYTEAHFATFPTELIEPCIMAGAAPGQVVLDPFMGSGTTAQVAQHLGRQYLGCELNPEYKPLQDKRISQLSLVLE